MTDSYLKLCPNPIGSVTDQKTGISFPVRCGKWTCLHCGIIKKAKVADRVFNGFSPEIFSGKRIRMITLTQVVGAEKPIMKSWANFRAILAKHSIKLHYFWTKEFTQNNERHLHVMVNAYIPFEKLRFYWWLATNGESFITWITGQKDQTATGDIQSPAGYATKYLTKSFSKGDGYKKKERRFGFSRNPLFKVPDKYTSGLDWLERSGIWKGSITTPDGLVLRYIGSWSMRDIITSKPPPKPPHDYTKDVKWAIEHERDLYDELVTKRVTSADLGFMVIANRDLKRDNIMNDETLTLRQRLKLERDGYL